MTKLKHLLFACLLLSACAHAPVNQAVQPDAGDRHAQTDQPGQTGSETEAPPEEATEAPPEEKPMVLPDVRLSSSVLYEYLLSEIAAQRGDGTVAVDGSLDLAKTTRDPRLAMRAANIALKFGQPDKAVEAFRIWSETDPSSMMAKRMLSSVLLHIGKIDQARDELAGLLKADENHAAQNFIQIYQMLAPYPDQAAALKLMRELAQPYPRVAEAHWAVAQLAQASGDGELALNEAQQARSLRPEWNMAVSLEAMLLLKKDPQRSLDLLHSYLSSYPDAHEIRMQYARELLDQKQYKTAREQFRYMADKNPDNPEFAYAIALISLQLNDLNSAETELKQSLSKGKKDQGTVLYYLGQLSEAKNSDDEAIAYYRQIRDGDFLVPAQIRTAYLLGKHGHLAEARQVLHEIQPADDQQRAKLAMIEAQLLREAGQFDEAYRVLNQALEKQPEEIDLLYDTAMMADKIGKPGVFEELMRKLIRIKPDYAQAYNALGYGMLERNERIPEAMGLVEKALQLAPNDPSIMDSVGWGYYRSGKLDESVKMLRRAYSSNPDPEIAAHLGEVLWMRGDKDEAKKIWQDSLKDHPGNEPLQAVIRKFNP
ncbi:MAG: tetratricopeptide repeat protein [Gallionella sp.]